MDVLLTRVSDQADKWKPKLAALVGGTLTLVKWLIDYLIIVLCCD